MVSEKVTALGRRHPKSIIRHQGCGELTIANDNLQIRLWANSAGGLHSKHCFSLARILERLILNEEKPITSGTLRPVCPGSMNNGGFILARLAQEGLVKPLPDVPHGRVRVDAAAYLAEMAKLMKQGVAIPIPEPVNLRNLPLAKPPTGQTSCGQTDQSTVMGCRWRRSGD